MKENEIFYSLSRLQISTIKSNLEKNKNNLYLNLIITFEQSEFNKIYKLLSNLYTIENSNEIEYKIWETFIYNKILQALDQQDVIYCPHDIYEEYKLLTGYNLTLFINSLSSFTTLNTINNIIKNQISKKVIVNYFQEETIIPISLQKVINQILVSNLPFSNKLYTTRSSLNSYYMENGYWLQKDNNYNEIWKLLSVNE